MGQYGDEFWNFGQIVEDIEAGVDISERLLTACRLPGVSILYFAPRSTVPSRGVVNCMRDLPPGYLLAPDETTAARLPRQEFPDGIVRTVIEIPEHITLWFVPGAFLSLREGVALIIRGAIRAEATEIFSLPDVRQLWSLSTPTHSVEDPATPAASAVVRIESRRMEEIRPEWFGWHSVVRARGSAVRDASAVTRALRSRRARGACRDAGVRRRVSLRAPGGRDALGARGAPCKVPPTPRTAE